MSQMRGLREETTRLRAQYNSLESRLSGSAHEAQDMSDKLEESHRAIERVERQVKDRTRDLVSLAETLEGTSINEQY